MTLTFTPAAGPSGVASVEYKIGSRAWTAVTANAGTYTAAISANGADTVSYRTTDNAGIRALSARAPSTSTRARRTAPG